MMRASLSDFEAVAEVPMKASGTLLDKMHTVWRRRGRSFEASAGTDKEVVVKILNVQETPTARVESHGILTEVNWLAAAQQHPNILGYHGLLSSRGDGEEEADPDEKYPLLSCTSLVVDYCSGGDLLTAVLESPLSEKRANKVVKGILSGLVHLHSLDIVHRDIKAENVSLMCADRPVISDFRIAAFMSDTKEMTKRCGSPGHVAPEIILGMQYGAKVDCFSTGATAYFVLSGQLPFTGSDVMSIMRRTLRGHVTFESPQFEHVSVRCKMFISSLLCKSSDDRPAADAALDDCWLALAPRE